MTSPTKLTPLEAIVTGKAILSNSLLARAVQCEQRFDYEYLRGWGASGFSMALNKGTWAHALVAAHNIHRGWDTLLERPTSTNFGVDELPEYKIVDNGGIPHVLTPDETVDDLWEYTPENVLDFLHFRIHRVLPKEVREELTGSKGYYDGASFTEQVWDLYTRWKYHAGVHYIDDEVLAVEREWRRPHLGYFFGGRVDAVVRRPDGSIVVRDFKTTSAVPDVTYKLTNLQTVLYAWGITPWLNSYGIDAPRFVELDYAVTKDPGLLRLKKDGDPYANVGAMDACAFLLQCQTLGLDPMAENLAKIREQIDSWNNDTHPYFTRWEMVVTEPLVDRLLDQHEATLNTIRGATEEIGGQMVFYPRRNLSPVGCRMCPFSDECALEFHGSTVEPPALSDRRLPLVGGGHAEP